MEARSKREKSPEETEEEAVKCLLCSQIATHRLCYGDVIDGKRAIGCIWHCSKHKSPHDEELARVRARYEDVYVVTTHALVNAADQMISTLAQRELAGAKQATEAGSREYYNGMNPHLDEKMIRSNHRR